MHHRLRVPNQKVPVTGDDHAVLDDRLNAATRSSARSRGAYACGHEHGR
jgi:hypothetical protein